MSRLSRRLCAPGIYRCDREPTRRVLLYVHTMMLAREKTCTLPRYLVLPPPTAAAPCLVQTFFMPVEIPAPAPAIDARHAPRECHMFFSNMTTAFFPYMCFFLVPVSLVVIYINF